MCIADEIKYQALAIDEHRNDFAPTLWDVRHPKHPNRSSPNRAPLSGVEQRWFVGAHANVALCHRAGGPCPQE
ncbi:phospholipase effector Tle1 domain-containing protein [Bradyrhizobium diversitatis]|uniref:phospholipase effector Tle1 domain-containing protein n=1 Tax=Bradyrhizobium diversitatis TaxID=2755406 RepID=UPI0018D780F4